MRGERVVVAVFACLAAALVAATSAGGKPSAGEISFDGTWEGDNPTAPWEGINASYAGGSYSFVKDPSRRGTVARVSLPAGGTAAVEAIHHRALQIGETTVYGFAYKFPDGWRKPTDGWGCHIAQLGYPLLKYTNIAFSAAANYVGLELFTGFIDWHGKTPSADNPATFDYRLTAKDPRGWLIPPRLFRTNVWHLLVVEVVWATGKTGSIRAWHQLQGDKTWVRTVDLQGIPTMQWGQGITGAYMDAQGKDRQGDAEQLSDKIGAYRDESRFPLTLYNDGLLIGSTPEVVAARLQGAPFQPVIGALRLSQARTGKRYRAPLVAAGGALPLRWSVASGVLPPGISLDRATGTLRGKARTAGRFRFAVRLTDGTGSTATRAFFVRVVR